MNSYEGTYVAKRAIVDYHVETNIPKLIDWREVKEEGQYKKVKKTVIENSIYEKLVKNYPEI